MFKVLNKRYLQDINTDIISDGNKYYVIDFNYFDGTSYYNCFEIDEYDLIIGFNTRYKITPVFETYGADDYKLIDYKIEEE
jgi:hypothetical protein